MLHKNADSTIMIKICIMTSMHVRNKWSVKKRSDNALYWDRPSACVVITCVRLSKYSMWKVSAWKPQAVLSRSYLDVRDKLFRETVASPSLCQWTVNTYVFGCFTQTSALRWLWSALAPLFVCGSDMSAVVKPTEQAGTLSRQQCNFWNTSGKFHRSVAHWCIWHDVISKFIFSFVRW